MYSIFAHTRALLIVMQVKLQTLAYYVTYIMYIFLFLFTCIVHISPSSPISACHGIYFISIIFIYLALDHICFMKTLLYFDLDDLIFLTNCNSSHCVSYVVYPYLLSHYDYG